MSQLASTALRPSSLAALRRPYPGLRPFHQAEWPLFFGREDMTDAVIGRLAQRCLLLVHGSSGAGKSSLIRAGVLPRLGRQQRRGGVAWSTATLRPSGGPLWNLATALAGLGQDNPSAAAVDRIRLAFDRDGARLQSIVCDLPGLGDARLCLLVDQFEELFQFAREGHRDEALLFLELLTGVLDDPADSLLRVVLTMRSEYLGECARLPGLARAVNETQYLVPRMESEALRRAIQRPAELFGGTVDAELARQVMEDAAGDPDELPLIQHGLMRMWDLAGAKPTHLTLELYRRYGPVQHMLDEHADAALDEAGDPKLAGELFRALTDTNADGQPIRRPQPLAALAAASGAPIEAVEAVLAPFREESAGMVTPYAPARLEPQTGIDLGHESLIRCWKKLSAEGTGWRDAEVRDGLIWRSLLTQADSFKNDPDSVLGAATTRERVRWMRDRTEAWAVRYGNRWANVQDLLNKSLSAANAQEQQASVKEANERAKIARVWLRVSGVALVLSVVFGSIALRQWEAANQERMVAYQALAAANQALSQGLWSDLDFNGMTASFSVRQRSALWRLTRAEPDVRRQFEHDLQRNGHEELQRFAAAAAPISLAIGWDWPSTEQAWAILEPELSRISAGGVVSQGLPGAADALAPSLYPAQVAPAWETVLRAIGGSTSPYALGGLVGALQALAPRLDPAQVAPAWEAVLRATGLTTGPPVFRGLGRLLQALAPKLDPGQVAPAWEAVLRAIAGTTDSDTLGALAGALQALAPRLDAAQVAAAWETVLRATAGTTDSDALGGLVGAFQALALRLNPAQVAPAEVAVLRAIGGNTNPHALGRLVGALQALAPRLDSAQVAPAWEAVVQAIGGDSPYALGALGRALQALAPRLDPAQVVTAWKTVLRAIAGKIDSDALGGLVEGLQALAPRLDPAQVAPAGEAVLRAIGGNTNPYALGGLFGALQALAPRLDSAQVAPAWEAVLQAIGETTNTYALRTLGSALQALAPRLDPAQVAPAGEAVLRAIGETTNTYALRTLGGALQALAPRLDPAQVAEALATIRGLLAWAPDDATAERFAAGYALLLRPSPPEVFAREIAGALRFPTSAGPATGVLLQAASEALPGAPEAGAGRKAMLEWLGRTYSTVDLKAPPACPPPPPAFAAQGMACPGQ